MTELTSSISSQILLWLNCYEMLWLYTYIWTKADYRLVPESSHGNLSEEHLRLLPTFAGALREKNRTRVSFSKIPTNYILVESLINVLYEKKYNFSK